MKLLLVDDEPGIREGLAALLRRKGHQVVTAGDCGRAGALLADGGDFDAVLTDWRLPDGVAHDYLPHAGCTVIAMSGHPEEIEDHPAVRRVLTKPVSPLTLLDVIAEIEACDGEDPATRALPLDVAALVAAARHQLGDGMTIEDDGTFVVARAALPDEGLLEALLELGGDLRVLAPGGSPKVEVRWCRDGRPDPGMPVAAPLGAWPEGGEFAVDFDGTALSGEGFGQCLDRAAAERARGRTVHFLNVPGSLVSWASGQGRSDDMPMRAAVGPRLPAVLADLWS